MFGFFFTKGPVTCFEEAKQSDTAKFGRFHRGMLERGVYLAPSAYEVPYLGFPIASPCACAACCWCLV
jgi:glutamate-1-semialdehyde 2,1-aminomutase